MMMHTSPAGQALLLLFVRILILLQWRHVAVFCSADATRDTAPGFDLWAPTYDTDAVELGWVAPEQAAAQLAPFLPALKALRREEPLRALDAGCGTGLMENAWRQLGIDDVVGVDLSIGMLEVARQRSFFSQLVHSSLDDPLPLLGAEFDVIACVGVLSYVREAQRRAVLEEFIRVARPGSLIAFAHRSDYVDPQGWGELQQALVDAGAWSLLNVLQGEYLPESSAYHGVTLTHFLYRKAFSEGDGLYNASWKQR
jgi:SAM-dependent methyltransferase